MGGQKAVVLFYEQVTKYHQVHLAVSANNAQLDSELEVSSILFTNSAIWKNLYRIPALRKQIKTHNVDCIIAEHSYTGWIAYLLRKLTGKPFVIRSHNIEASRFKQMGRKGWKLYSRYEKWIHNKADHSFFISAADLQTAIKLYKLDVGKCSVLHYGSKPFKSVENAKNILKGQYGVSSRYIFYFNGTHNYKPNDDAVKILLNVINPLLIKEGIDFTIVISGKELKQELVDGIHKTTTIRYLGFVNDAATLYQAADLFLNPVVNDSGVKTKVIEALGNHCTVVSTQSGAAGISAELCGNKLQIANDGNWEAFVETCVSALQHKSTMTPPVFFECFSWESVAQDAAKKIEFIIDQHGA